MEKWSIRPVSCLNISSFFSHAGTLHYHYSVKSYHQGGRMLHVLHQEVVWRELIREGSLEYKFVLLVCKAS